MKKLLSLITLLFFGSLAFSQIIITSTVTNVSCFGGADGAIALSSSGGTAPYTYSWTPTLPSSPNVSNLSAGTYSVFILDASANTSSLVISIGQPSQLNAIAVAQSSAACWCNGSASVTVTGGNPPYAYAWNSPFSGNMPQVTNLCPGVTQVNVTDANGCLVTQTVAIPLPPIPTIAISATNTSCQTNCNGSASATVTGGTGGYTYQWIGPSIASGSTSSNPIGMCAGFYTLAVTDAIGCQTATMVNVGVSLSNSLPNATVTNTSYNETCHLSGDGAIDISITGTNPGPFIYTWSNGANTQDVTNIVSNSYWVSIQDANTNCVTIRDTIYSMGINCGTISGNVYVDNNSDCIKNSGDLNFNNAGIIVNPGNRFGYTNTNGDYIINNIPYGAYSITSTNILSTCTTTLNTNVSAGTPNSTNNNLSVSFNYTLQPDMQVNGYSSGIVPGFTGAMYYNLQNLSMNNGSGIFKATLPSSFIANVSNASPNIYTISGDTIIWNLSNSTYGIQQTYIVYFTVPISTPLGSIFNSCGYVQTNILDINPNNNIFCYQRMVTGSFDPNDKTVSPVGVGANGDIASTETDLTYLIRFQNTGNGPAVNIVVKDTLSPNVDINTFEMLSASHNYNIDILPGNVLRWKFNNIMLADSGSNEPASHGYIQYRIKRTNNNTPGTQIKNTAYIYFDFNEPVVTNTAINTIETITGIKSSFNTNDEWNVYPNPSTGTLYIVNSSSVKEESQIQVINSIGQTVLEETITSNYKNVDLSKLNNGVYFVKIVSDKQSVIKRVVLSR
ncbi:MAG: T9SS type A sorting domain-containing protein [Bacteroidetes bacterium]|nr:T9SS type A sorting domain-containing protein [Bacteroidota bacterium]